MADQKTKTLGDKIAEANEPLRGKELASAQRADRVRALEEELAGAKTAGKPEARITAIQDEISRLKSAPLGRESGQAAQTAGRKSGPSGT